MTEETEKQETQEEAVQEEVKAEEDAKAEEEAPAAAAQDPEPEKPLDKMTAKELREVAIGIPGVAGVHAMKKEELLQVIKEARGIEDEAPSKTRQKKTAGDAVSVRDLKQKIHLFKNARSDAHEAGDRKKAGLLRRRINRLKKRTRKAAQV
jgi:hypothetical protein